MSNINDFIIENGVLTKYIGTATEVVIPNEVTCIGKQVFFGCRSLENIIISDSVTSICDGAFCGCTSLTSINIPKSVTIIGSRAFSDCTSIIDVTIPNNITSIGSNAFSNCTSLTYVTIPDRVTSLDGTFFGCASLTNIVIPNSVTKIGSYAFSGCKSLTSLTIPNSVVSIGDSAFCDCRSLTSLSIPDNVTKVGSCCFVGCENLKEVIFESNTVTLGELTFNKCSVLERIDFKGEEIDCYKSFGSDLPMLKVYFSSEIYSKKNNISSCLPYIVLKDSSEVAGLWIYQSGKAWDAWFEKQAFDAPEVLRAIAALLSTQKKITPKQIARLQEFGAKYSSVIPAGSVEKIVDGLLSGNSKTAEAVKNAETVKAEKINTKNSIPLEQEYADASSFSTELDCITKGVRYKDYDIECSLPVIKTLLEEYLALWNENKRAYHGAMSSGYNLGPIRQLKKPEEAEKIAAELDPEALSDYLEKLAFGKDYRFFAIPYARFATENSMQRCVKEIASKMKGNAKNQYWAGTLKVALQYSDTRAAAEYLEKLPMDFAKYTRLRGITAQ